MDGNAHKIKPCNRNNRKIEILGVRPKFWGIRKRGGNLWDIILGVDNLFTVSFLKKLKKWGNLPRVTISFIKDH